jgi:uncharacterized protein YbaR (Trm112 family)
MSLDPHFLALLRCPLTGQCLAESPHPQPTEKQSVTWLLREDGQGGYPIEDGLPILLPDRFEPIPQPTRN